MSLPDRPPTVNDGTHLSTDALLIALASQSRRILLFHLRQNRLASIDELVDVVFDLGDVTRAVGRADRKRLERVILEYHLPLLERLGLVASQIHDTVELAPVPDDFGDWLDLAVRREMHRSDPAEASTDQSSQKSITVLLVDDEPGFAELVGEMLTHHHDDMEVITTENAPSAYSVLEDESIDCVVSDYMMPAIDGLDFLTAVRDEYPALPFVLFTNKGSEEVASKAIASDVTAYVQKNQDTDHYDRLTGQIRTAVANRRPD